MVIETDCGQHYYSSLLGVQKGKYSTKVSAFLEMWSVHLNVRPVRVASLIKDSGDKRSNLPAENRIPARVTGKVVDKWRKFYLMLIFKGILPFLGGRNHKPSKKHEDEGSKTSRLLQLPIDLLQYLKDFLNKKDFHHFLNLSKYPQIMILKSRFLKLNLRRLDAWDYYYNKNNILLSRLFRFILIYFSLLFNFFFIYLFI